MACETAPSELTGYQAGSSPKGHGRLGDDAGSPIRGSGDPLTELGLGARSSFEYGAILPDRSGTLEPHRRIGSHTSAGEGELSQRGCKTPFTPTGQPSARLHPNPSRADDRGTRGVQPPQEQPVLMDG